jgi:hypothetical protein
MKTMQIHRSEGLRIQDGINNETAYLNPLARAAEDAKISLSWPEPSLLRIFPLADGRIAAVRETPYGLSQEAVSPSIEAWYQAIAEKTEVLIQKEAERKALAAEADTASPDEA